MSLALNEFLNLGYSIETCGQIAHKVEISLGGGLGDVIAQTGKGLVLRTLPGAPGIGEIKSFNEDVYVACKSFGDISTNNIITNPNYKKIISENGKDYVDLFRTRDAAGAGTRNNSFMTASHPHIGPETPAATRRRCRRRRPGRAPGATPRTTSRP